MKWLITAGLVLASSVAQASSVDMNLVTTDGVQEKIGTITIEQTEFGTLLTPDLHKLPGGVHGFHLHEKPSCDAAEVDGKVTAAGGAGGHWDPDKTKAHKGPYDKTGHKGDLPALYADAKGDAIYPVLAPRLKAEELTGHALMVHAGGDNHSDHPDKLGGGAARIACGIVK